MSRDPREAFKVGPARPVFCLKIEELYKTRHDFVTLQSRTIVTCCVVLNQTQRRQATLSVFSQGQAGQVSRFSVTVIDLRPV